MDYVTKALVLKPIYYKMTKNIEWKYLIEYLKIFTNWAIEEETDL